MLRLAPFHLLAGLVAGQIDPLSVPTDRWPQLVPQAISHGLGPVLYFKLRQQGALQRLPPRQKSLLQAEAGQVAGYNQLLLAQAAAWAGRFASAGIDALWLKGVPLALAVYPEPGLRPMSDIDVLVSRHQVEQALRLAQVETGRRPVSLGQEFDRHATVQVGPDGQLRLELHWSLVDLPAGQVTEDLDWFLRQEQTVWYDAAALRAPRPEAHLLYLCAHAEVLHGESSFRLLRYFDLHQLITQTAALDWSLVVAQAAAFRWTYAVERALGISHDFFTTPLPEGLLAELVARRPADENVGRVARWQGPGDRGTRLLARVAAMSWSDRVRYLVSFALPPPAYMRRRYHLSSGWQVPFAYPYRWLDAAWAVVKTVSRTARPGR